MQVQQHQDSIVKSLAELREIERQRIADELAAIQRADAERIAAREAAERQAREAAEARERAEREARLAAEHARLLAEQEERRRIDAAAAAELARQQIALEQARMEREVELRREEVARTRPTWMKAVTGLSLAAAGAMLWAALSSRAVAEDASAQARTATHARDEAREEAEQAREGLASVQREVEEHSRTIQTTLADLGRIKTQAERDALDARLRAEQQRIRDLEARREAILREQERRKRQDGIAMPPECKDNPFAPACSGK
jgi:hypothetical protein